MVKIIIKSPSDCEFMSILIKEEAFVRVDICLYRTYIQSPQISINQ